MAVEEPGGDTSLQVVAAIVHHTGRVLADERHSDGRLALPRGFAVTARPDRGAAPDHQGGWPVSPSSRRA